MQLPAILGESHSKWQGGWMNLMSCGLRRRWWTLAMPWIATLGVLTACAGPSLPDTAPASDFKEGVAAAPQAPPETGPRPVEDAQRDVVKTASMTIRVADVTEAADK